MPLREASLLTVSAQSIVLPPSVSVASILQFRLEHARELGRFRAAMSDMAAAVSVEGPQEALLWKARDAYTNRVVPALADLEDALAAGRIRFLVRSLIGATALSLAPVSPTTAGEGGLQLLGQTIEYRFSRKELLDAHPFAYLYLVGAEFGGNLERLRPVPAAQLVQMHSSPELAIREIMRQAFGPEEIVGVCVFSPLTASGRASGRRRALRPPADKQTSPGDSSRNG
jgi:hypothetical protein